MKIGIVTDFYYPWIGGPSAAIHNLARGLVERGHPVDILAPSPHGPAGQEDDGGIPLTRVPTVRAPVGFNLRVALPPRGIAAWLDRNSPDVVHIHHPFPLSAAAAFAARRRGIPVIATNHTIPECSLWGLQNVPLAYGAASRAFALWLRLVLGSADAVTTPTATASHMLREAGYRREVRVISNGLDTDRFQPGPSDQRLRSRLKLDGRPVVLYTGRLDPEKDMDTWLRAAAEISKQADVQFAVGGEGTDRRRLESLAGRLGLEGRIRFIGYVSEEELPALYRLAAIYLMLAPVELQSISTLEAMSSGLPVVAAAAGALPELVRHGENGFLVPTSDPLEAGSAVLNLLADTARREMMGRTSREIAMQHDLSRTITAYEQVFDESRTGRGHRGVQRASAPG